MVRSHLAWLIVLLWWYWCLHQEAAQHRSDLGGREGVQGRHEIRHDKAPKARPRSRPPPVRPSMARRARKHEVVKGGGVKSEGSPAGFSCSFPLPFTAHCSPLTAHTPCFDIGFSELMVIPCGADRHWAGKNCPKSHAPSATCSAHAALCE